MTVSIIIANYNGRKFLPRLCHSLCLQSFKNFEVIFVDNSSSDSSLDYIKTKYPKFKIIKTQNKGYGHGCNIGAKLAKGKFLIFLNPDMYCPKNFLKNLLNYRHEIEKKNPGQSIGAIGLQLIDFNSKLKNARLITFNKLDIFGNTRDFTTPNPEDKSIIIPGSPFLIKKTVYLETKGFNSNIFLYGEEVEYCWRLTILGYNNFMSSQQHLFHYGSGIVGKTNGKKIALMVYGNLIACYTNYSNLSLLLILPLYTIYYLCLTFGSILITKFKFEYFNELLKIIPQFIHNLGNINKIRTFTQKHRQISDWQFKKHFSIIPAVIARKSYQTIASAQT